MLNLLSSNRLKNLLSWRILALTKMEGKTILNRGKAVMQAWFRALSSMRPFSNSTLRYSCSSSNYFYPQVTVNCIISITLLVTL